MFPIKFIEAINRSGLVGVSAGAERSTPLQIWVVAVGNRLFARSWGLSERSWYFAFLSNARGFLECGGQRVAACGRTPLDLKIIVPLIDAAYLTKYDHGENSKYARGILEQQHVTRTLEFLPLHEQLDADRADTSGT
jgi:hypothetical protein